MNAVEILEDIAETTRPRFDVRDLPARERPKRGRGAVKTIDTFDRFMSKVAKGGPDDCWNWLPPFPRFHVGPRRGDAIEFRRYAWQQAHPDAKPPRMIYAACRNAKCCNPAHLSSTHPGRIPGSWRSTRTQFAHKERPSVTVETEEPASVSTAQPVAMPPGERTASAALSAIVSALEALERADRTRVLAAVKAFFGDVDG